METLWFVLLAFLLITYVVLDGFDLGAGTIHLGCARNDEERRAVLGSIGPVWDGNEVWLIAAGGTMFLAFPKLFAAAFSGFYLPLMLLLWLLILRGISIEFRSHLTSAVWNPLWDVVFALSSGALAALLGVALGNVVRGVPFDAGGVFFLPLWSVNSAGVIDRFTLLTGLVSFCALRMHGALWVALRAGGKVQARAGRQARIAQAALAILIAAATAAALGPRPELMSRATRPLGVLLTAAAIVAYAMSWRFLAHARYGPAFVGSSAFLAAMLASAAQASYPWLLASLPGSGPGLTIHSAAADNGSLTVALYWWLPGMALAVAYTATVYRYMLRRPRINY